MSSFHARKRLVLVFVVILCSIAAFAKFGPASKAKTALTMFLPGISATKVDTVVTDADSDGRADPGDTIQYDVTVTNGTGTDATGVKFTDTIDPNTTIVGGSLTVSPVAVNDSYTNPTNVNAPGVLANDYAGVPTAVEVISFGKTSGAETTVASNTTAATAGGGTIKVFADGSFTYARGGAPGPTDSFKYVISNAVAPSADTDVTATVTITFNLPPVIDSNSGGATATTSVAENQTAVTTVHATDPDNGPTTPVSYSIVGGDDQAKFTIGSSTGVLTFVSAPDFEIPTDTSTAGNNTYIVTVQASDGASVDQQTITVTVTNVNDAPVNTVPGSQTAFEDSPKGIPGVTVADDSGALTTTLTLLHGAVTVTAGGGAGISNKVPER